MCSEGGSASQKLSQCLLWSSDDRECSRVVVAKDYDGRFYLSWAGKLNQTGLGVTSITRLPSVVVHDEIDFFVMMQSIWRQKKVMAVVALLVGANKALIRVGAALDSYDTRLSYFRAKPKLFEAFGRHCQTPEQVFAEFSCDSLKLVQPASKKADLLGAYIGLGICYSKGVHGYHALSGVVQCSGKNERKKISDDLKVIISNRLVEVDTKLAAARSAYDAGKEGQTIALLEAENLKRAELQREIKALLVQLKLRREDRIAQLDEAISIARSLGLKKPSTPSSMASEYESGGNIIRTEVNNRQNPLYFIGTDALEAECRALRWRTSDSFAGPRVAQTHRDLWLLSANRKVQVLNQRESEEVFLSGIEPLRVEWVRLENINTDMRGGSLVNVDRLALNPLNSNRFKKFLITVLGIVLGDILRGRLCMRYALVLRRMHVSTVYLVPLLKVIEANILTKFRWCRFFLGDIRVVGF